MYQFLFLAQFLLGIINTWATGTEMLQIPPQAFWIENHWRHTPSNGKPRHWRAMITPIRADEKLASSDPNRFSFSGSASPTIENLHWIKQQYGDHHLYLIDLRQETHLYANGLPISIFYKRDEINWGKSPAIIKAQEQAWSDYLVQKTVLTLHSLGKPIAGFKGPVDPFTLSVLNAYPEEAAAAKAGLNYVRIEVPDYHPPSPAQVDQFLDFLKTLPTNSWLHFHCAGGKGRTSTFMVMTDIVQNGTFFSLEQLVNKQVLLGGVNLLGNSSSLTTQPWKKEYHQARTEFISLFYHYIKEAYPQEHFTSWFARQKRTAYYNLVHTECYFNNGS